MPKETEVNLESRLSQDGVQTHIVRELDQAKMLIDPLKLKVIQAFSGTPRTTKQVADLIDESPTKLYRHVDSLIDAGLLKLVEERPKRGTVEKYLQAIASTFVIDPTLFMAGEQLVSSTENTGIVDSILEVTKEELNQFIQQNEDEDCDHLLVRAQIRASKEQINELREKLLSWVEDCQAMNSEEGPTDSDLNYAASIAFYPLIKD
jgi:DNA-binding transcriptional ArsR family regulator